MHLGTLFKHLVEALSAIIFVAGMLTQWIGSHLWRRIRGRNKAAA